MRLLLRHPNKRRHHLTLVLLVICLALNVFAYRHLFSVVLRASGNTYYVSKNGNNTSGLDWHTAWNELDQIRWNTVQPGDTIVIDGGNTQQPSCPGPCMIYQTPLTVGRSGTSPDPVRIIKSVEPNHDGQAIITGGRAPLAESCIGSESTANYSGALEAGIYINEKQFVIIDGSHWGGLVIRDTASSGIQFRDRSSNTQTRDIIVRNVEIHHTGNFNQYTAAVELEGHHLTFENMKIWNNGEDAYHTAYKGSEHLTFRRNWIYYTYPRFDSCRHADGIQLAHDYQNTNCSSGDTSCTRDRLIPGIVVEDSFFGPYIEHGLILGEKSTVVERGQVQGLRVTNTTFFNNTQTNATFDQDTPSGETPSQNYVFDKITSYKDTTLPPGSPSSWHANFMFSDNRTATHAIRNSILVNRDFRYQGGQASSYIPQSSNNCIYNLDVNYDGTVNSADNVFGTPANPNFLSLSSAGSDYRWSNSELAAINLVPTNPLCLGRGSSVTSIAALQALVTASNSAALPPQPVVTTSPPIACLSVSPNIWRSSAITPQTGTFEAQLTVTPQARPMDGLVGLSASAADSFSDLAAIVRFNPSGFIDARNGSSYQAAAQIPYSANTPYRVRLVVNLPARSYSAYVTPPNQAEVVIGTNFAFRTEQASVSSLAYINATTITSSLSACDILVGPVSTPTPSPTPTPPPTPTPTPQVCITGTTSAWPFRSFVSQSGSFTATFLTTPSTRPMDGVVGLSRFAPTSYSAFAALVRFNPSGYIDARHGSGYRAFTQIPYSAGSQYRFRLVVNVPSRTYSAYVTPPGQSERTIATNNAFRTEQAAASSLAYWGTHTESGTISVCGFSL